MVINNKMFNINNENRVIINNNNDIMNNQIINNNSNSIICDYSSTMKLLSKKYFNSLFNENNNYYFPLKGLNNVGLTCYMNSILQFLLHVPELNNYFLNIYSVNIVNKNSDTKGLLSNEYSNILKNMYQNNNYNSFSPKNFNDLLSILNPQFEKYQSNDAKDLLLYLFQEMHEELNYFGHHKLNIIPKCNQLNELDSFMFFIKVNTFLNFSIFSYLFYGIVKNTTYCLSCKSKLYNFQYFQFLSFPLYNYHRKKFNIYLGFKDYIKKEKLSGNNQIYCQKCKILRDAIIKSKLYYIPTYLLINLDYGKDKKFVPSQIEFGEIIEITDFAEKQFKDIQYELVAVSTHLGSSGNSGHYIAYCKDNKNQWHEFNDSYRINSNFKETKLNSPYLLLYKKKV